MFLIENGAEINAVDNDGKNSLHNACLGGILDIVKLLIENGVGVNSVDNCGKIPLHYACCVEYFDIIKLTSGY